MSYVPRDHGASGSILPKSDRDNAGGAYRLSREPGRKDLCLIAHDGPIANLVRLNQVMVIIGEVLNRADRSGKRLPVNAKVCRAQDSAADEVEERPR